MDRNNLAHVLALARSKEDSTKVNLLLGHEEVKIPIMGPRGL